MISREIKNIIGENCPEYDARDYIIMAGCNIIGVSCENCFNYFEGNCSKGIQNDIYNNIKRN